MRVEIALLNVQRVGDLREGDDPVIMITYEEPWFHILFHPNKITEARLKKIGIPGPPWKAPKKLSIIRELNRVMAPQYTPQASHQIQQLIKESKVQDRAEFQVWRKSAEEVWHTPPREYQVKAQWTLHKRDAWALFLEQGLGKTKIVLDDFSDKYRENCNLRLLVVCPNYLVGNWVGEVEKHAPWFRCVKLNGGTHAKLSRLNETGEVFITNIESIFYKKFKQALTEALLKPRDIMAVIDESTIIKNATAKRTKYCIEELRAQCRYRRVLTGTPIPKDVRDLWAQLTFLDADATGYPTFWGFKSRFCVFGNPHIPQQITGIRDEDQVKAIMDKWATRMTKDEYLDLPPKIFKSILVEPTAEQKRLSHELSESCYTEFFDENGNLKEIDKMHILARAQSLRQIAKGFVTETQVDFNNPEGAGIKVLHDIPNTRYKALTDLVSTELTGKQFLVWTNHIHERHIVERELQKVEKNIAVLSNEISSDEVERIKKEFQDGKIRGLILSLHSFCRGVTLTAAEAVIYASNDYSWELRNQSEDRAHRLGLKHSVVYYDIIVDGTIDNTIMECLHKKGDFAAEFVDGLRRTKE